MSKKNRPKKKYRPRAVSVPPYLNSIDALVGQTSAEELAEKDRIFLLQVANRTIDEYDLASHVQVLRAAWVLAEKMENTQALRKCMTDGIVAIGCYLSEDHSEFTPECFEMLSVAVETCRAIMNATGRLERAQALDAAFKNKVNIRLE